MVVDTACDWVKPIYLTDHDIDVLDRQTKRDILACGFVTLLNSVGRDKFEELTGHIVKL